MAAAAATKSSTTTKLAIEQLEVEVGLYKATADPDKLAKFDSAGPNGGKLKKVQVAVATDPAESDGAKADPLGEDPGPELEPAKAEAFIGAENGREAAAAALVDGTFEERLVEEGSGVTVTPENVRRGIRLEDGRFIDCTDQLTAIDERTRLDEMRIVAFIDVGQVPRERVTASHYLGTRDSEALVALTLLHGAMKIRRRAAIVRWTSRKRQSLGVIVPYRDPRGRKTLLVLKLVWAEDFREAPSCAVLDGVGVGQAMVDQSAKLVDALSDRRVALDELRDEALAHREELKRRAEAGEMDVQVVEPVEAAEPSEDVGAALEASLAELSR